MARTAIIEITRKPTPRMVEALRTGAADKRGIIDVGADKRTHEGLVGRGMADWKQRQDLGASVWGAAYCVITRAGRAYLAKLDAPAPVSVKVTVDAPVPAFTAPVDPAPWAVKGARISVPAGKATVTGRPHSVRYIEFALDGTGEALQITADSPHLAPLCIRCDTVGDDTMPHRETENGHLCGYCAAAIDDEESTVPETPQTPAAPREGVTRGNGGTDEYGYPDRIPTLFVGEERYRLAPFAPAGVHADGGTVSAYNAHTGDRRTESYATGSLAGKSGDMPVAWRVDGYEWERVNGFMIRTEDRGHGIIAVYVKGSANDVNGADRAGVAYARKNLTFAPGMPGPSMSSAGGGEFADAGATYIAQMVFTTMPLAARQD
ncbi:hypothetical protein QFZ75_008020 [Streptomyces sp. V3I8]|uniref:hypothetical protein n=1 Tax=Streptomyces sp. V3I8 TaxID=3042279 RepID=UPI00277D5129|nr:hypothetical protein [Streptomyces sp. V3I8]MDQ1041518.1 hypothetical protein [Streptomyces sp. V3I8]